PPDGPQPDDQQRRIRQLMRHEVARVEAAVWPAMLLLQLQHRWPVFGPQQHRREDVFADLYRMHPVGGGDERRLRRARPGLAQRMLGSSAGERDPAQMRREIEQVLWRLIQT